MGLDQGPCQPQAWPPAPVCPPPPGLGGWLSSPSGPHHPQVLPWGFSPAAEPHSLPLKAVSWGPARMRACDLDAFSRVLVWPPSGHLFEECQKELAPLLSGAQDALQTPPAPKATRRSPRCPGCDDSSRTPGPSGWPGQGPLPGPLRPPHLLK